VRGADRRSRRGRGRGSGRWRVQTNPRPLPCPCVAKGRRRAPPAAIRRPADCLPASTLAPVDCLQRLVRPVGCLQRPVRPDAPCAAARRSAVPGLPPPAMSVRGERSTTRSAGRHPPPCRLPPAASRPPGRAMSGRLPAIHPRTRLRRPTPPPPAAFAPHRSAMSVQVLEISGQLRTTGVQNLVRVGVRPLISRGNSRKSLCLLPVERIPDRRPGGLGGPATRASGRSGAQSGWHHRVHDDDRGTGR
jgi:hypothetical protein